MEKWYFTFMSSQKEANNYVVFEGTFGEARKQMLDVYGTQWAFQYSESQWNEGGVSQAKRYNLTELC